jgi:hypothetical protein
VTRVPGAAPDRPPTRLSRRPARRTARSGAAIAAALSLVLVAPAAGLLPAAPAAAATTDLTLVTSAVYDVRPADGLVHVSVSVTAKNNKPETKAQVYFFDSGYLAMPPGLSGLRISGYPGATVGVSTRSASSTLVRLGFGSHLNSGQSRTFLVEFDLKDPGGDPERPVRISSSLAVFPVWAFASAGTKGSTVSVTFPAGYTVTVETGSFDHRETAPGGGVQLRTNPLAAPLSFFAYVLGERPPDTTDSPLAMTVGGIPLTVTLRAWADDPAWSKRIGGLLESALPDLSDQVGLPWPATAPTVIAESFNRTTGGSAALFDPAAGRIEISYWAEPLVTFHEVAHGWFNGTLVADRWMAEGFAAMYAQRVATALKVKDTSPTLTEKIDAARIPLDVWTSTAAAPDPATEAYGFAASLEAAREIAGAAGDDAMRAVWADAAARVGAYQPPVDASELGPETVGNPQSPEEVAGPPDWRGLLDLIEAHAGKDLSDLFRTWVVDDSQVSLLDARVAARISYARTLALADGWALPRPIRDALRAWQFDTADSLLAAARAVLGQWTLVEARAARIGLRLPGSVKRLFRAGAFTAASTEAQAENGAMLDIRSAMTSRPADPDILTRIGLLGVDPDAELATAKASLAGGSIAAAIDSADAARATWNGAWETGRLRTFVLVTALAVLAAFGTLLAKRRERRRRHARQASRPRIARPAA